MTEPPADPYFDALLRSGLINRGKLMQLLSDLEKEVGAGTPIDKQMVEQRLIAAKLITPWQSDKIRQGKFTGFFVGKYKLLKPLGKGGMGAVYLAEHTQMGRQVAIKILPPALLENRTYLTRFQQEARATAALDHPNIVRAYDTDRDGAFYYLVMEYVEGKELQKLVEEKGPLPFDDAANFIAQAARGLGHAHSRKMIHRDVKPANLLVTSAGQVKVLDLGVARMVDQEDRESVTLANNDDVIGTVDYIAPEQLLDSHRVDGRADLYSLGCTLYFVLTGKRPFDSGTWAVRLMKHQHSEPPSIFETRPDAPADLVEICKRMMAKKPDQRYATAEELAETLEAWRVKAKQAPAAAPVAPVTTGPVSPSTPTSVAPAVNPQPMLTPYQVGILTGQSQEPLKVEDYQILEKIETGRLQGLYRGRHQDLKFPVTIKLIRLEGEANDKKLALARFQREARISVQAHHSNLLRTFEVGKEGELCFFMDEELQGLTLGERLRGQGAGPPKPEEAVKIIKQAAQGLAHLHECEIVHRNVSPDNIWIFPDGVVKLIEFSLARDSLGHLDTPGLTEIKVQDAPFGGTKYLAPEHGFDPSAASAASDVYSLGCTLYHALTGRPPFEGKTPGEEMLLHAGRPVTPPSQVNAASPASLDGVVLKMLAKLPGERYQNAGEVAAAL